MEEDLILNRFLRRHEEWVNEAPDIRGGDTLEDIQEMYDDPSAYDDPPTKNQLRLLYYRRWDPDQGLVHKDASSVFEERPEYSPEEESHPDIKQELYKLHEIKEQADRINWNLLNMRLEAGVDIFSWPQRHLSLSGEDELLTQLYSSLDAVRDQKRFIDRQRVELQKASVQNAIYPGMEPENVIYPGTEPDGEKDLSHLGKPHLYTYGHDLERAYITNLAPWGRASVESTVFRKRTGEKIIAFADTGKRIDIVDWQNEKTVLDALTLAQEKWGKCVVYDGSDQYKQLCVSVAAKHKINLISPELQGDVKEKGTIKEPFIRRAGHAIGAFAQNFKDFAVRALRRDVKEINKEQISFKELECKEFAKKEEAEFKKLEQEKKELIELQARENKRQQLEREVFEERANRNEKFVKDSLREFNSPGHDPQKIKDLTKKLKLIADYLESQTGQTIEDIKEFRSQLDKSYLPNEKLIREPLSTSCNKGTIRTVDDTHIYQNVSTKSVMRHDKACINGIDTMTLEVGDNVKINYLNGKATIKQVEKEKDNELGR